MDVEARSDEDRDQLGQLIRTERDAAQRDRYRAVALALDGRQTKEIVQMLDRSRAFVQRWAYAYRDGGLEAIQIKKPPGKQPTLPRHRWDELRARIEAGPTEADQVCAFRGRDVQRILENEFGARYTLNGVYELLHRLGFSYLSPRPKHRKTDVEAQEAFKVSAPLLWIASGAITLTSGSKSGSRTS